jgi:TetR/AcrR family transcriptional repressor of nem operon
MDTKEHILSSAQRLVQQRGFNGFSYADVADEVGIRKASLHHHFASKVDLGVALVEAYAEQFDRALADIGRSNTTAVEKLLAYVAIYRATLESDRMCMCGMLATEALTLDAAMLPRLQRFFARNTEWLTELLAEGRSQGVFTFDGAAADHARAALSTLQGASLVCRSSGDMDAFDRTTAILVNSFMRKG